MKFTDKTLNEETRSSGCPSIQSIDYTSHHFVSYRYALPKLVGLYQSGLESWRLIYSLKLWNCNVIYIFPMVCDRRSHSRSLIIITNKIGPNFVLWGTSPLTKAQSDWKPSVLTDWLRLERNSQIHGITDSLTPSNNSFVIRMFWLMLSKSLLKSIKQTKIMENQQRLWNWASSVANHIKIRQKVVDVPFKLPNCCVSILFLTSSTIHLTTKSPRILDRQAVREIRRSSFSQDTDWSWGIGVIWIIIGVIWIIKQQCMPFKNIYIYIYIYIYICNSSCNAFFVLDVILLHSFLSPLLIISFMDALPDIYNHICMHG